MQLSLRDAGINITVEIDESTILTLDDLLNVLWSLLKPLDYTEETYSIMFAGRRISRSNESATKLIDALRRDGPLRLVQKKDPSSSFSVTVEDMKNNERVIDLTTDMDIIDLYRTVAKAFATPNGSFVIIDSQFNQLSEKHYEEKIGAWQEKEPLFFILPLQEGVQSLQGVTLNRFMGKKARLLMGNDRVFAFVKETR